jgi:hypothetical protein
MPVTAATDEFYLDALCGEHSGMRYAPHINKQPFYSCYPPDINKHQMNIKLISTGAR